VEFGAQADPQTEHFSTLLNWSARIARLASSRSFWSINGSGVGIGLRFILRNQVNTEQPSYAARSSLMMYAGSSEAEHREHFCPGFTLADFPWLMTVPSTVWVQIGQYTNACDSVCAVA
jgi:hypothetical protein